MFCFGVSKDLDNRFEIVCFKSFQKSIVNFGTLCLHIQEMLFKQESKLISLKTLT